MKKTLLICAALMLANAAFSQGTVVFANKASGIVVAPVYGAESDPTTTKTGNTATGTPAGSQTYSGGFLHNDTVHNWTATLWGIESSQFTGTQGANLNNNLLFLGANASATFRTNETGTFAGFWNPPSGNPQVPGIAEGDTGKRAVFQVRVWDNRGGQITSWAQALADPSVLHGFSPSFLLNSQLGGTFDPGGTPALPPNLAGLLSFNVFIVPEPSVIAIGVLGAGCLFLLRRRK